MSALPPSTCTPPSTGTPPSTPPRLHQTSRLGPTAAGAAAAAARAAASALASIPSPPTTPETLLARRQLEPSSLSPTAHKAARFAFALVAPDSPPPGQPVVRPFAPPPAPNKTYLAGRTDAPQPKTKEEMLEFYELEQFTALGENHVKDFLGHGDFANVYRFTSGGVQYVAKVFLLDKLREKSPAAIHNMVQTQKANYEKALALGLPCARRVGYENGVIIWEYVPNELVIDWQPGQLLEDLTEGQRSILRQLKEIFRKAMGSRNFTPDLHAGNFRVSNEGQVYIIDHMEQEFDEDEFVTILAKCLKSLSNGNAAVWSFLCPDDAPDYCKCDAEGYRNVPDGPRTFKRQHITH